MNTYFTPIQTDFPRKFTRGKVSIAITANFKNTGRGVHVRVSEIPGVISVRRPELFSELKDKSGLEFENFVYFRDESHYFIMTARKKSVVEAGIVKKVCTCVCNVNLSVLNGKGELLVHFNHDGPILS